MTEEFTTDDDRKRIARRTYLASAVAVGTALAGCSGGGDGGSGDGGSGDGGSGDGGSGDGGSGDGGSGDGGSGDGGSGGGGVSEQMQSEIDSYLSETSNYDSVQDVTGQSEVTVKVGAEGNGGNFAFAPAAIQVDPGTTVVWEWTGKGNTHNVAAEDGSFESKLVAEEGHRFEQTFDASGLTKYKCVPHQAQGMKGVVVV